LGDVIEDGPYQVCSRGVSVPAGDGEAFVAALSRIIHDRSLQHELGERGLEFVEVNYAKERLLEDIKTLYSELMNEGRVADRELRVADFSANSHSKFH
jgi:glycosyltransferase involved in cell wall biosynthesis